MAGCGHVSLSESTLQSKHELFQVKSRASEDNWPMSSFSLSSTFGSARISSSSASVSKRR